MLLTLSRMLRSLPLLSVALLGLPSSITAASTAVPVQITDTAFTPAIAIVAVGARVVWTNEGRLAHSTIGGFWSSPDLKPGGSFSVVFTRVGQFPYHDGYRHTLSGTVVVLAGSTAPTAGTGTVGVLTGVSYQYQGTATLTVKERWTYDDPVYQSETGPCNVEVGGGSRSVRWMARFPNLTYAKFPTSEGLFSLGSVPAKLEVYHESQQAKVSPGEGNTKCQDGTTSTFLPATEDAGCQNDLAGRLLMMDFHWSFALGSFLFSGDDNNQTGLTQCGPSFTGVDVLVGVTASEAQKLPLFLTGAGILYDDAQTAASPSEVALLRRDRPVHVIRQLTLDFTTPCCDGFAPHTSVLARIGAIWKVYATLDLQLQPREA